MNEAGILDGDIAILKKLGDGKVRSGDIVLVDIDGMPELRTFQEVDEDQIALIAASGNHPEIRRTRGETPIRGILVGVQRSL